VGGGALPRATLRHPRCALYRPTGLQAAIADESVLCFPSRDPRDLLQANLEATLAEVEASLQRLLQHQESTGSAAVAGDADAFVDSASAFLGTLSLAAEADLDTYCREMMGACRVP
jgi:hypothetical protein